MTVKSATQVERESTKGAFHAEPTMPAAEHVSAPITIVDPETGEVLHTVPHTDQEVIDYAS